jgi:hypothetical protein
MNGHKVIGLHIPKCAGSTLLDRVAQCLPPSEIYQTTSLIRNYQEGKDEITQIRMPERLRFVFGHTIHEEMIKILGPSVLLFTGLREPRERFISDIKYQIRLREKQGNDPLNVEQYIDSTRNPMCWYLIHRFPTLAGYGTPAERAFNVVKAFNYCYFTSNFEETAQAIFNALGIAPEKVNSNIAPKNDGEIDISNANLQWDIELYDRAQEFFLNKDPDAMFENTTPEISQLASAPIDVTRLRDFLYSGTFGEYSSWKKIDEIILKKMRLVNEITHELQYYMSRLSQNVKS